MMHEFLMVMNKVADLGLLIGLGVAIYAIHRLSKPRAVTIYFKRIEGVEKVETDA
jgi:hypothetical protein